LRLRHSSSRVTWWLIRVCMWSGSGSCG